MKRLLSLLSLLTLIASVSSAQVEHGVRFSIFVYSVHPDDPLEGFPDKEVDATIMYKDLQGNTLYTEDHTGTLDRFSNLSFIIGKGNNPNPPDLPPAAYEDVASLCWEVTLHDDEGPFVIEGVQDLWFVPKANFAQEAKNAEGLGGREWNEVPLDPSQILEGINPGALMMLDGPGEFENKISRLPLDGIVRSGTSTSEVTGDEVTVYGIGTGEGIPMVFGGDIPPTIEDAYLFCVGPLIHTRHGLNVTVKGAHSPTATHNTAAIRAVNSDAAMSAGVLASAQTWGLYGTAVNGAVGVSTGLGNGAGIWGTPGQAPADGGFKYSLYGTAQSLPGVWGAAIFGNGFYTGTWSMSSDARMKTEVRAQSDALDRIMRLRPTQYRYRQDTPYSLPDGIHHGFIAQEIEEVFPELVSDITMPLSTDPQDMHMSGTAQYKAINYIEIIAILTSAVQELNQEMQSQKAEIAELRTALQHTNGQK